MISIKSVLRFFILLLLFSLYQPGHANVLVVTGDVNRTQIQDGRNASVLITWTGVTTPLTVPNVPTNNTVFSNVGTFLIPNTAILGTKNTNVSTTVVFTPVQTTVPFTVRERLQIPASIIYAAKKQGSLVFQYSRTFADSAGGLTAVNSVQFQIVSTSRGELNISRVDVRFDNDQVVRVVPIGEKLSAVADINYNGVGLFDLAWEIATPGSTQGEAFFSTLHTQRRYLGAGREAFIQSPRLPTDVTGTYLVRLNIRSPETGFEPVVIRYVVVKSNEGIESIETGKINLSKPLPKAVLAKDTKFNWDPIDSANAYQLEIYEYVAVNEHPEAVRSLEDVEVQQDWDENPKARSTGILVHGDKHSVGLSPIAKQHLKPGRSYRWRVIAIGAKGRIIATSPLRTIHVP